MVKRTLRHTLLGEKPLRCKYCLTSQEITGAGFTLDHIEPKSKGGTDEAENLCTCCVDCNQIKSNRTEFVDPITLKICSIFHPNKQEWEQHFKWNAAGTHMIGVTAIGRATIDALKLNRPQLVHARGFWVAAGWHPPN